MRKTMLQAGVLAVLGLALVVTPASAKFPPVKGASKAANSSGTVTSLHEAKTLLDTAIHDYDGHRAKAVEEVRHALHELAPHHKGTAKAGAKGGQANTTPGENQAQSDTQLKQALKILSSLGETPSAKANGHIQTAITELNTALKIK